MSPGEDFRYDSVRLREARKFEASRCAQRVYFIFNPSLSPIYCGCEIRYVISRPWNFATQRRSKRKINASYITAVAVEIQRGGLGSCNDDYSLCTSSPASQPVTALQLRTAQTYLFAHSSVRSNPGSLQGRHYPKGGRVLLPQLNNTQFSIFSPSYPPSSST